MVVKLDLNLVKNAHFEIRTDAMIIQDWLQWGQVQVKIFLFLCCLLHNFSAKDVYWSLQLDEAKRQDLWDTKFHSPPLNVEPSIRIPSMFIDPVVDVFVDPCDPTYRRPSRREKEKFLLWTQRYKIFIFFYKSSEHVKVTKIIYTVS